MKSVTFEEETVSQHSYLPIAINRPITAIILIVITSINH